MSKSTRKTHEDSPESSAAEGSPEVERIARALSGASTFLRDQMSDHPKRTLALAAGVGVVMGGGFWRLLAQPIMMTATRWMLATAATNFAAQLAGQPHTEEVNP